MEIQLQELIEKIKKDGVAAAESEAEKLLNTAKSEAEKIISDAKSEAEKIISDAKAQSDNFARSGEDAVRQAGRNLLITLRESVKKEIEAITNEKISEVFSKDVLLELIPKMLLETAKNPETDDVAVLLGEADAKKLEDALMSALKEKVLGGVTLKAIDGINGGFRIAVDNGSAYYDYSAGEISDMLCAYLSPKVAALMKEADC